MLCPIHFRLGRLPLLQLGFWGRGQCRTWAVGILNLMFEHCQGVLPGMPLTLNMLVVFVFFLGHAVPKIWIWGHSIVFWVGAGQVILPGKGSQPFEIWLLCNGWIYAVCSGGTWS